MQVPRGAGVRSVSYQTLTKSLNNRRRFTVDRHPTFRLSCDLSPLPAAPDQAQPSAEIERQLPRLAVGCRLQHARAHRREQLPAPPQPFAARCSTSFITAPYRNSNCPENVCSCGIWPTSASLRTPAGHRAAAWRRRRWSATTRSARAPARRSNTKVASLHGRSGWILSSKPWRAALLRRGLWTRPSLRVYPAQRRPFVSRRSRDFPNRDDGRDFNPRIRFRARDHPRVVKPIDRQQLVEQRPLDAGNPA
jgi:hypothetical protein